MKNKQPSDGFTERNERAVQQIVAQRPLLDTSDDQELLDYLIASGFVWEEAVHLLGLREHLYENDEMRQRMADDHHIQFMRWLYENGELTDF